MNNPNLRDFSDYCTYNLYIHMWYKVILKLLVKLPPTPPPGGYSQWQSQIVARWEGKCRAPVNNQFYTHDNSPRDRVYGQTAEHSKSRLHNLPNNENIIPLLF